MVTTKITISPYLCEYIIGKYNNHDHGPVQFPDNLDIYHAIDDLLERRPANVGVDTGNLEIFLPEKHFGKNRDSFNYMGVRSAKIIEQKILVKFWSELHDLLDEQKHMYGIEYINTVYFFLRKYDITSIPEDTILKNYQRWREKTRKKEKRRSYVKKHAQKSC